MILKTKPRKCKNKGCGKKFENPNSMVCWCSVQCGYEIALERRRKNEKVEWKERKKVIKEKLKTLGEYEKEAKREFQKWIRGRDRNLPCISCGATNSKQWDGGHYLKSELYSGLIFHEDNCHRQCARCNNWLNGNEIPYRIELVKRIGEEQVKWLEDNKDQLRLYKFTKQELIEIKNKYKIINSKNS